LEDDREDGMLGVDDDKMIEDVGVVVGHDRNKS
jgi:hypothetical protein